MPVSYTHLVRLSETGADGFVPVSTLGADYFAFDEAEQKLVGSATGLTYQLGDDVDVRLVEVAPLAGSLRFEMLSDGKPGKAAGERRGRKGRFKSSRPSLSSASSSGKSRAESKKKHQSPAAHAKRAVRKARGR